MGRIETLSNCSKRVLVLSYTVMNTKLASDNLGFVWIDFRTYAILHTRDCNTKSQDYVYEHKNAILCYI